MAMQSAQQIAEKWSRNLGASTQAIREGVQSVTVNPMARAAERVDAYVAGIQRAVADGKYQDGLRRVSLEQWKDAMLEKGLSRVGTGASQAMPKFADFMSEFIPHLQAGVRALETMPRGDLSQNVARAVAMMQHNARFRRRR